MTRRSAVVVGALVLVMVLAGCSAAGSLTMQQVSDAELAAQTSRPTAAPEEGPTSAQRLVRRAIENGSATASGRRPPVESGLPFAHEGRYYDVSWAVTGSQQGTLVDLAIDYNGTASDRRAVAYESLPVPDRRALGTLLPPRTERRTEGYDFGVGVTYNATERDRSVLLSEDYEAVRYEGETYPIDVRDVREVRIKTYRYTTTVVANDSAAYASQLRAEHLFTLSELSDQERTVVEEAIEGGYYAEDTDDEAFESVLERFRRHEAIQATEYEGTWLVRYEGDVYLADLYYDGFAER